MTFGNIDPALSIYIFLFFLCCCLVFSSFLLIHNTVVVVLKEGLQRERVRARDTNGSLYRIPRGTGFAEFQQRTSTDRWERLLHFACPSLEINRSTWFRSAAAAAGIHPVIRSPINCRIPRRTEAMRSVICDLL